MAIAGILAVSCSQPNDEASDYGTLDFASAVVTVEESDISQLKTRAVATDDFVLTLTSAGGVQVGQWTVDQLPGSIELPTGNYDVTVGSPEVTAAGWDCPWYYASQTVTIERDQTATAELVCKMNNIKVTVEYDQSFLDVAAADVEVTVTVGGSELVYALDETRAGYFPGAFIPLDMTVTITGTVNGEQQSASKVFNGIAPGDWQNVTIDYKPVVGRAPLGIGVKIR